ncbi:beta-lactamase family protein [Thermobifida halotolerans]|uniref:Beta-lactamase family protein n=1 Tax=Thermobifida halotolerans TaxID=483545 RepID=A0AA97M0J9_9ACTN|nr:serine hydrolase domain-containing protein [Thermobifida halotolerans]UOE21590.1 beta-lactamase family protein [Thermobifida halotolerans]
MSPRTRSVLSLGASAALTVGLALAAGPAAWAADSPAEPTPENVREFLDGRVPEILEEHDVPGAVVSVVADGEEVFAGGYGLADVASATPVDVANDSFPLASISKSFTAVAVLQLAEQGRVDLHADVNEYLPEKARLPDTHPGRPVTLHHLLTHTAGFEEAVTGMFARSRAETLSLTDYVVEHRPERVYEPGKFVAYSNYGTTLAGLVVQEVSGVPFAEYADENVFGPLGMDRSGFLHPDEAAETLNAPTLYGTSPDVEVADMYVNQSPAGGAYATASDMARYMLALLDGGELDGTRVLSAESVAEMTAHQAGAHGKVGGSGYGTWEDSFPGPRSVGHGGDLDGAHTHYLIVPEEDLGVFVAVNGDGGPDPEEPENILSDARHRIVEEFLTEFAGPGEQESGAEVPAASRADLERYEGVYTTTRTGRGDLSALFSAFDTVTVEATADGLHTAHSVLGEFHWTRVGPGLFRTEEGDHLAFIERDGEVVGLGLDFLPSQNYERMPWYNEPVLHLAAAGAALLVMSTALAWPVAAVVRRVRGRTGSAPTAARVARWTAALAAAVCLGFTAVAMILASDQDLLGTLVMEGSPLLTAPLTVAAAAAAVALGCAVWAWAGRWWGVAARVHHTLVALAAVVFVAVGTRYGLTLLPVVLA